MIEEKDIRKVYEVFYEIVEKYGDKDCTRQIAITLSRLLTNLIAPTTNEELDKIGGLVKITKLVTNEYYPKFLELANRQEAKSKWKP